MGQISVEVNFQQIMDIGGEIDSAKKAGMQAILDRGVTLVNANAPVGKSGFTGPRQSLARGSASEILEIGRDLQGQITVTAISPSGPTSGLITLKGGRTKTISLKGAGGFDYAMGVSQGTGTFGPAQEEIIPTQSQALLIPVDVVPTLNGRREVFIDAGGQKFIIRKRSVGQKPNPFISIASDQLENEAQGIFDAALDEFVR